MSTRFPLELLAWVSPAFPIGSFSYSHGLESRIDDGKLATAEALELWLTDVLEVGGGWSDAVMFVEAYRAAAEPRSCKACCRKPNWPRRWRPR